MEELHSLHSCILEFKRKDFKFMLNLNKMTYSNDNTNSMHFIWDESVQNWLRLKHPHPGHHSSQFASVISQRSTADDRCKIELKSKKLHVLGQYATLQGDLILIGKVHSRWIQFNLNHRKLMIFDKVTFICHHFMCSTKQLSSLMQFSLLSHQDLCHQHKVYYDFSFFSLSPSIL